MPNTTVKSLRTAVPFLQPSFCGTADGNRNPVEVPCIAPALAVALGWAVAVIKNPLESYDGGAFDGLLLGPIVTKTGKPCSFHRVTTSGPEEGEPGEEGDCKGEDW